MMNLYMGEEVEEWRGRREEEREEKGRGGKEGGDWSSLLCWAKLRPWYGPHYPKRSYKKDHGVGVDSSVSLLQMTFPSFNLSV